MKPTAQLLIARTVAYQLAVLFLGSILLASMLSLEAHFAKRDLVEQESGR